MLLQIIRISVLLSMILLVATPAFAQKLNASSAPNNAKDYLRAVEKSNQERLTGKVDSTKKTENTTDPAQKNNASSSATNEKNNKEQIKKPLKMQVVDGKLKIENMPEIKTTDGSKRGTAAFVRIPKKNEKQDSNRDEQLIFLYYDNFKITRSLSGGIGCDVKFAVMTNLDQRLANLSVKLKWPGMTTSLNFNNVNPNIETYFNYALFGEGCYTMDKIPNIIVNRCRIKGMSQEKCASKIRWLSRK